MKHFLPILAFAFLVSCSLNTKKDADEIFVEKLLAQMTLEEKLGQMILYSSGEDPTVPVFNPEYRTEIEQGRCGAVFASITPDSSHTCTSINGIQIPRSGISQRNRKNRFVTMNHIIPKQHWNLKA